MPRSPVKPVPMLLLILAIAAIIWSLTLGPFSGVDDSSGVTPTDRDSGVAEPTAPSGRRSPQSEERRVSTDGGSGRSGRSGASGATGGIRGRVLDLDGGEGIAGSRVHMAVVAEHALMRYVAKTVTRDDGSFEFDPQPSLDLASLHRDRTRVLFLATKDGYSAGDLRVSAQMLSDLLAADAAGTEVSPDDELRIEIEASRIMTGRVVDSRGHAVPGADVSIRFRSPHGNGDQSFTDADGFYRLAVDGDHLPWDLRASALGFGTEKVDIKTRPDALRMPDLVLRGDGVLRGQIVLASGAPAGRQRLSFDRIYDPLERGKNAFGIDSGGVITDEDGNYRVGGMRRGRYALQVLLRIEEGRRSDLPLPEPVIADGTPRRHVLQPVVLRVHAPRTGGGNAVALDRLELFQLPPGNEDLIRKHNSRTLTADDWRRTVSWGWEFDFVNANHDIELLAPAGTVWFVHAQKLGLGFTSRFAKVRAGRVAQRIDLRFPTDQVRYRITAVAADGGPLRSSPIAIRSLVGFVVAYLERGSKIEGHLPPGRYEVFVDPANGVEETVCEEPMRSLHLQKRQVIELVANRENRIEVRVERAGQVMLRLNAPPSRNDEQLVRCALVAVHVKTGTERHLNEFRSKTATGIASGMFCNRDLYSIDPLEPGAWRFELRDNRRKPLELRGTVHPDRFCILRFELPAR